MTTLFAVRQPAGPVVVDASTFRDVGETVIEFGPGLVEWFLSGSRPAAVRWMALAQTSAWGER